MSLQSHNEKKSNPTHLNTIDLFTKIYTHVVLINVSLIYFALTWWLAWILPMLFVANEGVLDA